MRGAESPVCSTVVTGLYFLTCAPRDMGFAGVTNIEDAAQE